MINKNKGEINVEETLDILEDIVNYLQNRDPNEYEMNQQYIRMSKIFQGFVVKDWKGADFNCNKYHALDKILIFNTVQFYRKC